MSEDSEKTWEKVRRHFRRTYSIDIVEEYKRLKEMLMPRGELRDASVLAKRLEEADWNAYMAGRIFLLARWQREVFRLKFSREMAALNRDAITALERERELAGGAKKQITIDMVDAWLCANSLRYVELNKEQEEHRFIRDDLKMFAQVWSERSRNLRAQKDLVYRKAVVFPGRRSPDEGPQG